MRSISRESSWDRCQFPLRHFPRARDPQFHWYPAEPGSCVQLMHEDATRDTLLQTAGMATRGQHCCFLLNKLVTATSSLRGWFGKSSYIWNSQHCLGYVVLWCSQLGATLPAHEYGASDLKNISD